MKKAAKKKTAAQTTTAPAEVAAKAEAQDFGALLGEDAIYVDASGGEFAAKIVSVPVAMPDPFQNPPAPEGEAPKVLAHLNIFQSIGVTAKLYVPMSDSGEPNTFYVDA